MRKEQGSFLDDEAYLEFSNISMNDKSSKAPLLEEPMTEMSTLDNGLRVASQNMYGLMSSFSFTVCAGSAHEQKGGQGLTQMIELTAFQSTGNRSRQDVVQEMESMGGLVQCISSRDCIMYCVDVLRENLAPAMELLADVTLAPRLTPEEIGEGAMIMQYQEDELPGEMLSRDAVAMAAYRGSPLGNHHYCPTGKAELITSDMLHGYRNQFFTPSNCHLAAAGVDHREFLDLAGRHFSEAHFPSSSTLSSTAPSSSSLISPSSPFSLRESSKYVGGLIMNQRELKEPYFIKIAVAFETCGLHSDDVVPVCVLQQLLGGGSSFSAGGPGKGMYTRLYRELLNRYYWVEGAESFLTLFDETGVFGIDATCLPDDVQKMLQVIIDQLVRLAYQPVTDEELNRAKNMLKSMMLMQLESRLVLCEDISRQVATYKFRENPQLLARKIDAVTTDDLQALAMRMIRTPPSVGAVGHDLKHVPPYENIASFTEKYIQSVDAQLRGEGAE